MPPFEFRCCRCDHQFESLIRNGESAACPECGSGDQDKLLSAPSAHTNGSSLPIASSCPPSNAPPCSPGCCRLP
ncbi:MAG: zinc ribbon domain-containing protein [Planctomycetaceae bacterium]|nr:zinc ribbon domain-containing protein [Planctomycetaceae bacterium]